MVLEIARLALQLLADRLERREADLAPVARQIGRPLPLIVGRELFNSTAISFDWDVRR